MPPLSEKETSIRLLKLVGDAHVMSNDRLNVLIYRKPSAKEM